MKMHLYVLMWQFSPNELIFVDLLGCNDKGEYGIKQIYSGMAHKYVRSKEYEATHTLIVKNVYRTKHGIHVVVEVPKYE